MVENESISKKERMDIQLSGDLLSDLPLSIIHIILAFVPIKDAVKTSILSRQWRYTWTSLPYLVFDDECVSSSKQDESVETRLCRFITQALCHHKGPIHKCIISIYSKSKPLGIDEWIPCLSRNDIKELTLETGGFSNFETVQVPSSIYSCEKLTHLEVVSYDLDPPPSTFKGFVFLRCLILGGVFMSPSAIESLVANSPLLETFELCDVSDNSEFRISAPNLKYLTLSGHYEELFVYAPLLIDMSVTLYNGTLRLDQHNSSVCNYANFMGGFTNLEKLCGFEYFTKYLRKGIDSCHQTVMFHQLKDIELEKVNVIDTKDISVVARLIVGAPNLEKLEINASYEGYTLIDEAEGYTLIDEPEGTRHLSFRDFGCGPNFTFEKLRVVVMPYFYGFPLEMELVEFLLESSPVLQTMDLGYLSSEKKLKSSAAELLGFYRASSNAKVHIGNF